MSWLGSDLQPAIWTVFDVGIVSFRLTAVVPIIGRLSLSLSLGLGLGLKLRLRLNLYDLGLLLDINRWRRRHCNGGRIPIIWCIPVIRRISIRWGSASISAQAVTQ